MAAKRGLSGGLDIKLTPGGIRDIEFLAQVPAAPAWRPRALGTPRGTALALFRLRDKGLLSGAEYPRLASAYEFLRYLGTSLQMEDDRRRHTLPADPEETGAARLPDDLPKTAGRA